MKLLFAALFLLLTIALICSPLYLVYIGPECQLLGEGGARGDRAGALPGGKAHLYHHGQGLEDLLKPNPSYYLLQPFLVTVSDVVRHIDTYSFDHKIIVCIFAADNRNV